MEHQARRVVAVTGATGFVGRYVVREMLRRGWNVRALARSVGKARGVLPVGQAGAEALRVVDGDVFDPSARGRLIDGAGAVIHLIGIRRERRGGVTFRRMHVDATRTVLHAAHAARVARFAHMSALGVRPNAPTEYQRSKWEAEALVREGNIPWVIFRPSFIHGPEGEFVQMVAGWGRRRKAPWVHMPFFERVAFDPVRPWLPPKVQTPAVQPVAVVDVAWAVGEALDRGVSGETYALGGPEAMSWPAMLETLRDAIPGTRASVAPKGLPAPAALFIARAARAVGLAEALPFGTSEPVMAAEDNVCCIAKARAHLGFEPVSLAAAAGAYGRMV